MNAPQDLNNLIWSGLFINDLSMHDYSRDMMLAATQEKIQLKMLLETAEKKSTKLNEQLKKLDDIQKKSEDLISQMLPKQVLYTRRKHFHFVIRFDKVADDLASGKTNQEVCKAYDMVTMLFSDIVTFTVICSRLKPLQVQYLVHKF